MGRGTTGHHLSDSLSLLNIITVLTPHTSNTQPSQHASQFTAQALSGLEIINEFFKQTVKASGGFPYLVCSCIIVMYAILVTTPHKFFVRDTHLPVSSLQSIERGQSSPSSSSWHSGDCRPSSLSSSRPSSCLEMRWSPTPD